MKVNTIIKKIINYVPEKLGFRIIRCTKGDYTQKISIKKYKLLIKEIEGLYRKFLFKELPFMDDEGLYLMSQLKGTNISEAIYILNYLTKSLSLEGDICEFGVAQGATSALMAYKIKETAKNIWLFDSFEGLPKPSKKDILKDDIFKLNSIEAYEGTMSYEANIVTKKLHDIKFPSSRVNIIPGFIEESIKSPDLPEKVCFAYVDFDFYEPILTALNFLDKILMVNGFVIVDDYNYFSTGAKTAVDEFFNDNKEKYKIFLPLESAGNFCILEKKY